jgi:hypothetical protein
MLISLSLCGDDVRGIHDMLVHVARPEEGSWRAGRGREGGRGRMRAFFLTLLSSMDLREA